MRQGVFEERMGCVYRYIFFFDKGVRVDMLLSRQLRVPSFLLMSDLLLTKY